MNNLVRFKMKMLIVLTFCVFMTFSMLVYVMRLTEKCENSADDMCFHASKTHLVRTKYFIYNSHFNFTRMTAQILKPFFTTGNFYNFTKLTTEKSFNKTKRTTREVFKVFNISLNSHNFSLKNEVKNSLKQVPLYSISHRDKYSYAVSTKQSVGISIVLPQSRKISYNDVLSSSKSTANTSERSNQSNSSLSVYFERHKNLRKLCHKYFDISQVLKVKKLKLNHILIDEKHKILYCYVPKVACTNWKRIFLVLTGKVNNISEVINLPSSKIHAKNLFKSLQNYSISEVQKITQEYTKFIFVRHPFERLLSAYRNKLEQHYDSSKYFQARFGKYIIKNFRKNPSNVSLEKGDDVTFAEFARYLISSNPTLYNEHWQRVVDLCHPCLINYDFIGKYESLIEDSNFLLKHLGFNVSFPVLPKPSTTALNLKKYYNTLDNSTIYKLYSIYEMDFKLFDYDLSNTSDNISS